MAAPERGTGIGAGRPDEADGPVATELAGTEAGAWGCEAEAGIGDCCETVGEAATWAITGAREAGTRSHVDMKE